jgi:hypothetical protein
MITRAGRRHPTSAASDALALNELARMFQLLILLEV